MYLANDVEDRFNASAYNKVYNRRLPIGKNRKVPGFMKDELSGKIMIEFAALDQSFMLIRNIVVKKTFVK